MANYVDIRYDAGFKIVFGDPIVMKNFLNAYYDGEREVISVTYLDKEIQPEVLDGRTVIFDLLCHLQDDTTLIVEMQLWPQSYFVKRSFYYLCRMVNRQGKPGKGWKYDYHPVHVFSFVNFPFNGNTGYRTDLSWVNLTTHERPGGIDVRQTLISLPLFNLTKEVCMTDLELWIYSLKHMDISIFDNTPYKEKIASFLHYFEVADVASMTEKERDAYEWSLMNLWDFNGVIDSALERGEKKGRMEGIAEGKLEGLLQVATKLKHSGLDPRFIAQNTGLSIEEIQKL